MKMKKTLQGIVLAASIGAASVMGPQAIRAEEPASKIEATVDNALETALVDGSGFRTRLYTDFTIGTGKYQFAYHGMNETTDFQKANYCGRQVFAFGRKDAATMPIFVMKTDAHGAYDMTAGIRNTGLISKLGCYGWADVTASKAAGDLTFFVGKELPKGVSVELTQCSRFPFKGQPEYYTELQVNKKLSEHSSAFVRGEFSGFSAKDAKYMAGFAFRF